jgi:hypothetical protein
MLYVDLKPNDMLSHLMHFTPSFKISQSPSSSIPRHIDQYLVVPVQIRYPTQPGPPVRTCGGNLGRTALLAACQKSSLCT